MCRRPLLNQRLKIQALAAGAANILDGSAIGSVRTVGSTAESSSYTIGQYAFAEGCNAAASGNNSHAEGYDTAAYGESSHAEGRGNSSKRLLFPCRG